MEDYDVFWINVYSDRIFPTQGLSILFLSSFIRLVGWLIWILRPFETDYFSLHVIGPKRRR